MFQPSHYPQHIPGRKIGLLGGSFNPAHEGHLHLSLEALRRLHLDEIWWLVSPQNPLKSSKGMDDYAARMESARKIVAQHPHIKVLDIEVKLGTRYTVDTVAALQSRYRKMKFVWLMGADNLAQFHRWRQWKRLMNMLPVAVFDRAPFSHKSLRYKASLAFARWRVSEQDYLRLANKTAPAWAFIYMRKHAASSTAIRKSLGKFISKAHNQTMADA